MWKLHLLLKSTDKFSIQLCYRGLKWTASQDGLQSCVSAVHDLHGKCWECTSLVAPQGTVLHLRTAGSSAICLRHAAFSVNPFSSLDGSSVQQFQEKRQQRNTDHMPVFHLMSPSLRSVAAGFSAEISSTRRPVWASLHLQDRWVFEQANASWSGW